MKKIVQCVLVILCMVMTIFDVHAKDRVDILLEGMSIEEKITQMLMVDFRQWGSSGDFVKMNDEVEKIIRDYDFGAVILFSNNIKETKQSYELCMDLQRAQDGIPLLIACDQEGGLVYRLGSGTALPGNMALGACADESYAFMAGEVIGSELSSLGINTTLAPVVDVNSNVNNTVIGLRSYGEDATVVGKLAASEVAGLRKYNVVGCAKHFPGHGDTAVDSHYGLPLVDKSKDELMKCELLPYKMLIDEGIDMIMSAHILYPQLDNSTVYSTKTKREEKLPSTLSYKIMTGLLKEEMNFDGVIVTDAMNMAGIASTFNEVQAVKLAINAGVDMICMPTNIASMSDLKKLDRIIDGVKKAVETGEIKESRIDDAVSRILSLKEKNGILDFNEKNYSLEKAMNTVGCKENKEKERRIAARAVTVLKNENDVLPLRVSHNSKILLVAAEENQRSLLSYGIERARSIGLIPEGCEVKITSYLDSSLSTNANLLDGSNQAMKSLLDWCDTVISLSDNSILNQGRVNLQNAYTATPYRIIDYAKKKHKKTIIMSVNKPYDVQVYDKADAIMCVYGSQGDPTKQLIGNETGTSLACGPNISAGIEVAFGIFGATGTLPVTIPYYKGNGFSEDVCYDYGYGLFYDSLICKDELIECIDKVSALESVGYTIESWNILEDVLNEAKDVVDRICSQDEVDLILEKLNDAYDGLEEVKKNHHYYVYAGIVLILMVIIKRMWK